MGRPKQYSVELPARCQALIDRYGELIGREAKPDDGFEGPLKTTFLLAMATPILVLPLERVFRPAVWNDRGVADDLELDGHVGDRVRRTLGERRAFGAAPFFRAGVWSYIPECPRFEVGRDWPEDILAALASPEAASAAAKAPASEILMVARNGIAHGGVTYLDADGRHTRMATHMLGFASFVSLRDRTRLRILRVGVDAFEDFLRLWTNWLLDSGAAATMQAQGPGYFDWAAE